MTSLFTRQAHDRKSVVSVASRIASAIASPFTLLDALLDRITTYRLALYVLLGLLGLAAALGYAHLLPFSPVALLLSAGFLTLMCWAANTLLARIFAVPTNLESATITALILALMLDPAQTLGDVQFLGWAAILAMSSKYIVAINKKHIFNPAAIAAVITAFALKETASWWVGTASMLPAVLIGGFLIVRKVRQEALALAFLGAALVTLCLVSLAQPAAGTAMGVTLGTTLELALRQLLVESPLFFVASVMLTEPRTLPPTQRWRSVYGVLTGILFVPLIHLGPVYSTPELALIVGNAFSYLVSPKYAVALTLKRKKKLAPDVVDFLFTPSRPLTFTPGQYIECTLAHPHPDQRGNRRYFTLASSPTEETLHLGVRFSSHGSSFKRALAGMTARTSLLGAHVAGDFTLPADPTKRLVFIAGGIGITPYRSMLKYLVDMRQRRDIVLFYAVSDIRDFVYTDVLQEAQTTLGVKIVYTGTNTSALPPDWQGQRGRITGRMITETMPEWQTRIYYISGPPNMVKATRRTLRHLGVPRRQIKTDYFPGL